MDHMDRYLTHPLILWGAYETWIRDAAARGEIAMCKEPRLFIYLKTGGALCLVRQRLYYSPSGNPEKHVLKAKQKVLLENRENLGEVVAVGTKRVNGTKFWPSLEAFIREIAGTATPEEGDDAAAQAIPA